MRKTNKKTPNYDMHIETHTCSHTRSPTKNPKQETILNTQKTYKIWRKCPDLTLRDK